MLTQSDSATRPADARLGITAVIPCLDEAAGIARAYAEVAAQLERYDAELLFVDDGSTDATLERIKDSPSGTRASRTSR